MENGKTQLPPAYYKAIFVDLETTGLDPVKNAIVQIAGSMAVLTVDPHQMQIVDIKLGESFNFKVRPRFDDEIDPKALEVIGKTEEDLMAYPKSIEVKRNFTALLNRYVKPRNPKDKIFFIGYNANFDYSFLYSWFLKHEDNYLNSYFFTPAWDVMALAAPMLMRHRGALKNFKLETVGGLLRCLPQDIEEGEQAHDAMYDIKVTANIFHKCSKRIELF